MDQKEPKKRFKKIIYISQKDLDLIRSIKNPKRNIDVALNNLIELKPYLNKWRRDYIVNAERFIQNLIMNMMEHTLYGKKDKKTKTNKSDNSKIDNKKSIQYTPW